MVVVDRPLDPGSPRPCGKPATSACSSWRRPTRSRTCRCPSTWPCGSPARPATWACSAGRAWPTRLASGRPAPRRRRRQFARDLAGLTPATAGRRSPPRPAARPALDRPQLDDDGRHRRLVVDRPGPAGGDAGADRPRARSRSTCAAGPARPGRRHHRLGQVRAAADPDRRPGAEPSAPDRCSFLLVDYKGGAAFAEAAALPHTVGLVTDLDGQTTARALRSLGAELTRREAILAAAPGRRHRGPARRRSSSPGWSSWSTSSPPWPRNCPSFVPGLVSIAQRGRSLGVHLVLATQRPGGVVSPEIRANCTLRICLRTTDEADSRDVLGTPDAAHLPVDLPGRAYLRTGSGAPSRCRSRGWRLGRAPRPRPGPEVRGGRGRTVARVPRPSRLRGSDLAAALPARSLATAAATACGRPTGPGGRRSGPIPAGPRRSDDRRPAGPSFPAAACRSAWSTGRTPDPASRWTSTSPTAARGWPSVVRAADAPPLLRTVLGEAVHRLGPGRAPRPRHRVGRRSLGAEAAALPHTGTTVGGDDVLRTGPAGRPPRPGGRCPPAGTGAGRHPLILLLVDGVEAVSTVLDDADPGRGSASLLRLMRDGAAVGLTCVVTADRAVPGGRLAAAPGSASSCPCPTGRTTPWPASPRGRYPRPPAGRGALLGEEALECQLASPRPEAPRRHRTSRR